MSKSRILTHQPKPSKLVPLLLAWFSDNARDLPWRRTRDPYAIWISEIMLQQTQVKTVIPYWKRWMRELPTIQAAAEARPARLHKLWEGLGYYTRVRNVQRAAQKIQQSHQGRFPQNLQDVLALPGVGRYTAGAICSIAFNRPAPILDGNVMRVLTRIFGITTDPRAQPTNRRLWQLAEELVHHASLLTPHASPCSHLNQSLMELGALVCTPRSPQCQRCPVETLCVARRRNLQNRIPARQRRHAAIPRQFVTFIVKRDGKFLVRQRPERWVNAHLWEFPNLEVQETKGRTPPSRRVAVPNLTKAAQKANSDCQSCDFHILEAEPICTIKHSITRYRITLQAYRAILATPRVPVEGRWLPLRQLRKLAFTSAHRKILAHLEPQLSALACGFAERRKALGR